MPKKTTSLQKLANEVQPITMDHIPAIARLCHKMNIAHVVNESIPAKTNIDLGTNVVAMIVDTLSGRSPLYHVENFYENQDTELLFGKPIDSSSFNDDALGRTLDRISKYGTLKLFTKISLGVAKDFNLDMSQGNFDTTSVNVWGNYENSTPTGKAPHITHGYSKDKRPDLKQFMVSMLCVEGNIPIVGKMQDGNASDVTLNNEELQRVSSYLKPLKQHVDDFIYVADCKLVTPENLKLLEKTQFISRLPANYSIHDKVIFKALEDEDWEDLGELAKTPSLSSKRLRASYQCKETQVEIDKQSYRAIVVKTQQLDKRKTKGIENRKQKQFKKIEKAIKHYDKISYYCLPDAQQELKKHIKEQEVSYWKLTGEVVEKIIYSKGRPSKSGERKIKELRYSIKYTIEENKERLQKDLSKAGCFVLISNVSDEKKSSREILKTYKSQYGIEQNFSFLKEPLVANDTFLKTPERIDALIIILLLSLMVWNLIQRQLRQSAECKEGKLKDLNKRPTYRPTAYLMIKNIRNIVILKRGNERILPKGVLREQAKNYLHALGLDETCYTQPPRINSD